MARFPHVRAAFNQTAFIESLNLQPQVLADIWLPVGFPPVSFEALGEEEEKVAQTGQFSNSNLRSRNSGGGNFASGDYQQHRGNRSANARHQNNQQQPSRSRGTSFTTSASASNRNFRQSYENVREEDDVIEDPDNLWATPTTDTFGSSDFGTFDENGMFRAGGSVSSGAKASELEDFAAFEGFVQTRPHHIIPPMPEPAKPAAAVAPSSPPVAIPHITPETQWLYRDPSGQIQGPFPSHRMMEWYNGKYFPENLPLRREQDPFFEPLSTWKSKCAGQVPFVAYTKPTEPVVKPQVNLRPTTSVSVSQWFSAASEPAATSVSFKPQVSEPAVSVKPQVVSEPTTRSVPIESLFSLQPAAAVVEKPPSPPEVMMPSWKKLDKPSITTKFGQLELEEKKPAEVESIKIVQAEPVKLVEADLFKTEPAANLAASISASSSWSNSSGSLKKISLSEILKTEEPVTSSVPVAPAKPVQSVNNAAGWAKLSASPVQSLSSIQAEEAARQRASSVSASSAAAASSKSFADLVRSAGVITSGNIIVSPSVSDRVPLEATSIKPIVSSSPATVNAPQKTVAPVPTVSPASTSSTSTPVVPANNKPSLEEWCLSTLRQSGQLAKSIDPQTCTILLMDLPNPAALLTFALETLKPLDSNFDLATFIQEVSLRKFGQKATEKVQWSKLKSVPQTKKQEDSFEVVKRKK